MERIYLVQHKNITDYTKIGFTTRDDVLTRISELNTASPTGIILIREYLVPDKRGRLIEQTLHRKYAHLRTNLEWFALTEDNIVEIDNWINKILTNS